MTNNKMLSSTDQTRLITGAAGGALVLLGLKKRGVLGLLLTGAGGYLAYRAATGEDLMAKVAGISQPSYPKPIFVESSIVIDKSAQDLYDIVRKLDTLPSLLSHLESVTVTDDKSSRWVAKAPLGTHIEWDSEIVNDKPGQRIGWHSLPGATVDNAGSIQFEPLEDSKTRLHVALSYRPPAGALGNAVTKLFGPDPSQQLTDDLSAFKATIEAS